MTAIKLKHYCVKRGGRGFWTPTKKMRAVGFASVPCGPDGPEAWAIAEEWERRWQATRRGDAPFPCHDLLGEPIALAERGIDCLPAPLTWRGFPPLPAHERMG
jgi:hypothetical protein